MLTFTLSLLFGFLVTFVALTGVRLRRRIRRRLRPGVPVVDDEALAQILERGVLISEEVPPLDHDEIDDAHRRFWSDRWDEPEEW